MTMPVPPNNPMDAVREAIRAEQLGHYTVALEAYVRALQAQPNHPVLATRYFRLQRDLRPPPQEATLLWQVDPSGYLERDWVRELVSGAIAREIADGHHREFIDGAVIVDNRIDPGRRAYYFELLRRGCRFVLFHLSDEHYTDDCSAYEFANGAIRNYWSRLYRDNASVLTVPLGSAAGFAADARKTAAERAHLWAFAGNVDKQSRHDMLLALSGVQRGHAHATAQGDPRGRTPLSLTDYARLLSDAVFAPCPAGWENLDSFRVCEALDSGCIPIVEKRPGFDYFRHLVGPHPVPTVERWSEVPSLIATLASDAAALEARRRACVDWWRAYKSTLATRVQEMLRTRLFGESPR